MNVQKYMQIAKEIMYLPTVETYRIPSDKEIKELMKMALYFAKQKRIDKIFGAKLDE